MPLIFRNNKLYFLNLKTLGKMTHFILSILIFLFPTGNYVIINHDKENMLNVVCEGNFLCACDLPAFRYIDI